MTDVWILWNVHVNFPTIHKCNYTSTSATNTALVWFYGVYCHFQQYFSYIVAISFIGGGNRSIRRKPPTCRKSLTIFITKCCIEYTSHWMGFELTTLVVTCTDCTGIVRLNSINLQKKILKNPGFKSNNFFLDVY